MFGSTMVVSVGQALERAREDDLVVRLHVGGEWISGRVLGCDAHGVALEESDGGVCVVRTDAVAGVRLPATPAARPSHRVRSERVDTAPRGPSAWS